MSEALNESASHKSIPIVVGAESEIGRRGENQDHMTGFPSRFGAVYVVADGMGGHRGGAEASRIVTESVRTHLLGAASGLTLGEAVAEAGRLANRDVFAKSASGDPNFSGMGSTLCLVVIGEGAAGMECVTAHVGDSRVYLERGGRLSVLTKDHSRVQKLLDLHIIDEEMARTHPEASILTRAMGQNEDVAVDVSEPIPLLDGDGILLCSDGLSGFVRREQIEDTIARNPGASECAKALIELALANGSDDNITVQFVRYGGAPSAPVTASRGRKTVPESEVFPTRIEETNREKESQVHSGRSRSWFVVLAAASVLSAGGVYAFRNTLFSKPPVSPSPYAAEVNRAEALRVQASALHDRAATDLAAVQSEIDRGDSRDGQLPKLIKIERDFNNESIQANTLALQAQKLKASIIGSPSERRDRAKAAHFTDESTDIATGLKHCDRAVTTTETNFHVLQTKKTARAGRDDGQGVE